MDTNQVMVKMVLDRWFALVNNFEKSLSALTDEQLQHEIAPGRNRGIYLVGHLVAVHDDMLRKLDLGDMLYPHLEEPFIKSPDKAVAEIPSAAELRANWAELHTLFAQKINAMQPAEWFERHTAVSAEDFQKEPHRNKLNILLTRCTHLAYHHGQFILIK
jgi:hypothetical protein